MTDKCSLPCFGKILVDSKDIYTEYLTNSITPLLYEGFRSCYIESQKYEKRFMDASKKDSTKKNHSLPELFRYFTKPIREMNNNKMEEETIRIRNNCGCADIFDDLIRATIKGHILVLTCSSGNSKLIDDKFHETVNINTFIHKCYIESAKLLYDNCWLLDDTLNKNEIKNNQQHAFYLIKIGIRNAIKNTLPMRNILQEYLDNDISEISKTYMNELKDMIVNDLKKSSQKNQTDKGLSMLDDDYDNDEINNASDDHNYCNNDTVNMLLGSVFCEENILHNNSSHESQRKLPSLSSPKTFQESPQKKSSPKSIHRSPKELSPNQSQEQLQGPSQVLSQVVSQGPLQGPLQGPSQGPSQGPLQVPSQVPLQKQSLNPLDNDIINNIFSKNRGPTSLMKTIKLINNSDKEIAKPSLNIPQIVEQKVVQQDKQDKQIESPQMKIMRNLSETNHFGSLTTED